MARLASPPGDTLCHQNQVRVESAMLVSSMYSVSVRDHFMIAHSFHGEVFGPAQRLHGATYVVDVEFRRPALDADGIVVDIGRATEVLNATCWPRSTTGTSTRSRRSRAATRRPKFLAREMFDRIAAAIGRGDLGPAARGVESVRVTLHESHVASASFEGAIP